MRSIGRSHDDVLKKAGSSPCTTVATKDGRYTVAYALFGDGVDSQEVRVSAPIDVEGDDALAIGQRIGLGFGHSDIGGVDSVHHVFLAGDDERDPT